VRLFSSAGIFKENSQERGAKRQEPWESTCK
jgi:hypothetical protein